MLRLSVTRACQRCPRDDVTMAINLSEVLTKAIEDVQSVPLRTIKAARVLVVDSEWAGAQSASDQQMAIDLARAVYNTPGSVVDGPRHAMQRPTG